MCKWVLYSPTIDAYSQHCIKYTYFSSVIVMIVLHNRDHSMSISDIVPCVSESPWARGGCSGAPVHLHWWGWIQPHEETKEGKECHQPACHCGSSWAAWREHHNVCSHYPPRHHPSPCYSWSLQHRPSDHIPGHPTQHTHSTRSDRRPRAAQLCCHLGQRKFPLGCSGL